MFLRALWIALLLLASFASVGQASTGIRVTGESRFRASVEPRIVSWLKSHGHTVAGDALDDAATSLLDECYARDEPACASAKFYESGKSDLFLYFNFDVESFGPRENNIRGTLWILRRDSQAQVFDADCNRCDDDAANSMVDELASHVGSFDGRLGTWKLTTTPPGASVEIDGRDAGLTPLSVDLRVGKHQAVVRATGFIPEQLTVEIDADAETSQVLSLREPRAGSSKLRRVSAYGAGSLGLGLLAAGTVAVLIHEGSPCESTQKECLNSRPAGIAMLASGAVLLGVGGYLWFTMEDPVTMPAEPSGKGGAASSWMAPSARGARGYVVGWGGRF